MVATQVRVVMDGGVGVGLASRRLRSGQRRSPLRVERQTVAHLPAQPALLRSGVAGRRLARTGPLRRRHRTYGRARLQPAERPLATREERGRGRIPPQPRSTLLRGQRTARVDIDRRPRTIRLLGIQADLHPAACCWTLPGGSGTGARGTGRDPLVRRARTTEARRLPRPSAHVRRPDRTRSRPPRSELPRSGLSDGRPRVPQHRSPEAGRPRDSRDRAAATRRRRGGPATTSVGPRACPLRIPRSQVADVHMSKATRRSRKTGSASPGGMSQPRHRCIPELDEAARKG